MLAQISTRPSTSVLLRSCRRSYFYTKYGELVSKPAKTECKLLNHPVLGLYYSEFPAEPSKPLITQSLQAQVHPTMDIKPDSRDLISTLRTHHMNTSTSQERKAVIDKLALGQLVHIRRRIVMSKPQANSFVGVVIEVNNRDVRGGLTATVRLRGSVHGTGVELLVPLMSPLLEHIAIVKEPEVPIPGPNLHGLRDRGPEAMERFFPGDLMNEKGRLAYLRQLDREWRLTTQQS